MTVQGKIISQFWGKLIRHFSKASGLLHVTWVGVLKLPEW